MKFKNFKIYTLGCKVNQCDSDYLSRKLIAEGLKSVEEKADLVIINSCAVTQTAIRKGRQAIAKAKKENPAAKIVLMGCFPRIYSESGNLKVNLIIKEKNLDNAILKIKNKFNINSSDLNEFSSCGLKTRKQKAKYFLKIQDGCEQFCSYCIIPYARGKLKSRSEKEILAEFKTAVKAGYSEIILCGIHLGLFGKEKGSKNQKTSLLNLLKKSIKIKGLGRIRLSSIELNEVSDDLIKLISQEKKICAHLHIPLQSGCDKILKSMNRPYSKLEFKNKINKIRSKILDIAITTDVIVGFPGETDKDFNETFDFIKEIGFSKLHVFPFSAHEKTPAGKMKNQIKPELVFKRAEKLRNFGRKLEADFKKKFKGKEVEVLVEQIKEGKCLGKTEQYFDLNFKNLNRRAGDIVKIKIF